MERGNVLVIGNSGVGKSTLINSVLGENKAKTGFGTKGTTGELEIYDSAEIPFRLIDTVGFEPNLIKAFKATNAVRKWSKVSAKAGNEDNKINLIWFCVDGTTRKLFPEAIKSLTRATSMWRSVPIVVVITKSFGGPDRVENIKMVNQAFDEQKEDTKKPKAIIPVVAETYEIDETTLVPPEGITELIDITNELMPEGIRAGSKDLHQYKLKKKRTLAHSIVGLSTTAAVTVGAVPIPIADALILAPIELAEIRSLARIYEINKKEKSKKFINDIVEIGTVSKVAKLAISGLKAIPGVNIGASVLNAIIAGAIVAAIGQGSIYVFEKIYIGEKSIDDIDWVKRVMEAQLSNQFIDKVTVAVGKMQESSESGDDSETISSIIMSLFTKEKVEIE